MSEPIKRRKLSKPERKMVYDKCVGHCAYCGRKISINEMQVDHVVPLNGWRVQGTDTLDNMLPACRSCNHYKSWNNLEDFREAIENQPHVLARDSTTYQIAVRYGLVKPNPHHVVFYFEKMEGKMDEESNEQ